MPAFCVAISPTVSPRNFWWSKSTEVRADTRTQSSEITFVASVHPPMPTSRMMISRLCRFEYHQCGGGEELEARCRNVELRIDVFHHSACTIIQVRRRGSPFITMESRTDTRWGLLNLPTVNPLACNIDATNEDTLPFPLVPVMWIVGNVYGGRCVSRTLIRSSESSITKHAIDL
jgi:hypothetical protein